MRGPRTNQGLRQQVTGIRQQVSGNRIRVSGLGIKSLDFGSDIFDLVFFQFRVHWQGDEFFTAFFCRRVPSIVKAQGLVGPLEMEGNRVMDAKKNRIEV